MIPDRKDLLYFGGLVGASAGAELLRQQVSSQVAGIQARETVTANNTVTVGPNDAVNIDLDAEYSGNVDSSIVGGIAVRTPDNEIINLPLKTSNTLSPGSSTTFSWSDISAGCRESDAQENYTIFDSTGKYAIIAAVYESKSTGTSDCYGETPDNLLSKRVEIQDAIEVVEKKGASVVSVSIDGTSIF